MHAEDVVKGKGLRADIMQEVAVCFERAVEKLGPEGKGFVREGLFERYEIIPLLLPLFVRKVNLLLLSPLYQRAQSRRETSFKSQISLLVCLRRR